MWSKFIILSIILSAYNITVWIFFILTISSDFLKTSACTCEFRSFQGELSCIHFHLNQVQCTPLELKHFNISTPHIKAKIEEGDFITTGKIKIYFEKQILFWILEILNTSIEWSKSSFKIVYDHLIEAYWVACKA